MGALRRYAPHALFAIAAAGLVLHMRVFQFVTDDAFISFVYARNFAEHGQLVFNLGERVEGYTNFLWTVLLAGLMKIGWRPESASVVWGTGFAIATMAVCAWLSRRLREGAGDRGKDWSAWDAVPALFLAAVPGYACWSAGGLETQMFTFFVTLATALYLAPTDEKEVGGVDRLRLSAGIAFGLAALTRPEGNLFFLLAMLHRTIHAVFIERRLRPTRSELAFCFAFVILVAPHFGWRRLYYGWWLPNTFYIKSSGGKGTWARGLVYLQRHAMAFLIPALLLPPVASLYRAREPGTNRLYRYALLVLPVFWIYVGSVGGDFMGLYRFALPVMPLVVLCAAVGMRELLGRFSSARIEVLAMAALLVGYVAHTIPVDRNALGRGSYNGIDEPGWLKWYTDDRAAIGKWFGKYARPDDYAAVGGAGAQVYYSGIPSLDCYGLSDAHIAHDVKPVDNRPGHEKYAPVEYQLSKRPTIITSNYYTIGNAPNPRPDEPFWKAHGYRYVSVEVPGLSSPWYTFLLRNDRGMGPIAPIASPSPVDHELQ